MTERGGTFTQEEICEQARANLTAFILTAIMQAQDDGRSVEEWARDVGRRFATGWSEIRGRGAEAAARAAALNIVSAGGDLRSITGDETRAEAVVVGWPTDEALDYLGLQREDVVPFLAIFEPIAEYLGLRYTYEVQGETITLAFIEI